MSITIHAGETEGSLFATNQNAAARRAAEKGTAKGRSTVFAGDMAVRPDSIMIKKQQAQKQAMKIVGDTFDAEKKVNQSLKDMADRIEELKNENLGYGREIRSIDDKRNEVMEGYGITEDSQEQKDLELLRKERDMVPGAEEGLIEEEMERLSEIHKAGVTDYQKDMLELDEQEKYYRDHIEENNAGIKSMTASLRDTKLERLKSDPMVKAAKQSEEIMEAANKDMIGALYNEAKEHIEEKMQEEKEKAEKRAEKKEEEEKRAEAKEEREELQEELLEKAAENDAEMDELLDKFKLIDEDLKGAAVDKNL